MLLYDPLTLTFYSPAAIVWGHDALMAIVCPSVCVVPDPKSKMKGQRKLKIGRKEALETSDL